MENAVCCNDGLHCCPRSFTCDVEKQLCISSGSGLMLGMNKKIVPTSEALIMENTTPTSCKTTCDKDSCCNFEEGVCCPGANFCCPKGYTCNLSANTCQAKVDFPAPWLLRMPSIQPALELNEDKPSLLTNRFGQYMRKCEDGHSTCPDSTTCCKLTSGVMGCCPMPKAICCSDGKHCCPEGTKCDIAEQKCIYEVTLKPSILPLTPTRRKPSPTGPKHNCPDSTQCNDFSTCCPLPSGDFGCCPMRNATCCSDKEHCCPKGFKCDVQKKRCTKTDADSFSAARTKLNSLENIKMCPDRVSSCPNQYTCCTLADGKWGCCPIPKAICCKDGIHCCPSSTTCNDQKKSCFYQSEKYFVPWLTKQKANRPVLCKSNKEGKAFICPLKNGICCDDGKNCCPQNSICDTKKGRCILERLSVNKCKDGSTCPQGTTCCSLTDGKYGCCPLLNAVCCSDNKHCCPQGTTCDIADGTCTQADGFKTRMVEKLPSTKGLSPSPPPPAPPANEICPDGKRCSSSETCCRSGHLSYGCCPLIMATCCSDKKHCCPQGTSCSRNKTQCVSKTTLGQIEAAVGIMLKSKDSKTNMVEKFSSTTGLSPPPNQVCPDGEICSSSETCCRSGHLSYGCCPLMSATCCSDNKHCCPQGTTCDISDGTCTRADGLKTRMVEKLPSNKGLSPSAAPPNNICPDGNECDYGNTCCQMFDGNWGCCAWPSANCCSDHVHCCPQGFACHNSDGTCQQNGVKIPWKLKKPTLKAKRQCDSSGYACPSETTCCKLKSGGFGCCPHNSGVCCPNVDFCCPQGFKCDVKNERCEIDLVKMTTQLAKLTETEHTVICEDGFHECPHKSVCDQEAKMCQSLITGRSFPWVNRLRSEKIHCRNKKNRCPISHTCCESTNKTGCCPYENAVCCNDGKHCCPVGHQCSDDGLCIVAKNTTLQVNYKSCGTNEGFCEVNHSCCSGDSGDSCCPFFDGVCCGNGLFCCPQGSHCDVAGGKCLSDSNNALVDFIRLTTEKITTKTHLKHTKKNCETCETLGGSCCKKTEGCCNIKNGQCCTKGKHCCPIGSTCLEHEGKCRVNSLPFLNFKAGTVYDNAEELSVLEETSHRTFLQESIRNIPAESEVKLLNSFYRLIKSTHWIVCDDKVHFCPIDRTCCKQEDNYNCAPRGASCCAILPTSCPRKYSCTTFGYYCIEK